MNKISDLIPHLEDRGVTLSASQIYRLIGGKPERMNLALHGTLLDALDCTFEELCPVTVVAVSARERLTGTEASRAKKDAVRPVRAPIHRPE